MRVIRKGGSLTNEDASFLSRICQDVIDNNSSNFFQLIIVVHIDVIWPLQTKASGGGFRQVETTVKPRRCMKGSKFPVGCGKPGGSSSNNDHCRAPYGDDQGLWFQPTPCSWKVAKESKGQGRSLAMPGLLHHGQRSSIGCTYSQCQLCLSTGHCLPVQNVVSQEIIGKLTSSSVCKEVEIISEVKKGSVILIG
jgi:hypothetical protein